jgi:transposase
MTTIACAPEHISRSASPSVKEVTGGVDTHADTHTAAVIDAAGRLLGSAQFPTTTAGYRELLGWLCGFGTLVLVGIEGTGVYGAGLARFLTGEGVAMVEVDRPDRKTRRLAGKSDPLDAEAAARAALPGRPSGTPKERSRGRRRRRARSSRRRVQAAGVVGQELRIAHPGGTGQGGHHRSEEGHEPAQEHRCSAPASQEIL